MPNNETAPRLLAFAGSLRKESLNKKTLHAAVPMARAAGAEVTHIDLADFRMPVYDGDLEEKDGLPDAVRKFKVLMKAHDGFLICTPEYNSSIPGMLKNVIDWASRSEEGEEALACFTGKTAGLMSASPGMLGGIRSLATVRAILENLGTIVVPAQVAIPKAHDAFSADGTFGDAKRAAAVGRMVASLVDVTRRLKA